MGPIRKLFSVYPDQLKQKTKKDAAVRKDRSSAEILIKNKINKKLFSELEKTRYLDKIARNAINYQKEKTPERRFFFDDEVLNDLVDRFSANPPGKN